MKRNEVLSFDDGLLTIKVSGHGPGDGWGSLAFKEQQFELDADGYQVIEIPPSELRALRDFLNRVVPMTDKIQSTTVAQPTPMQRPEVYDSNGREVYRSAAPRGWLYTLRKIESYSPTRLPHCIALGWHETPLYEDANANPASRSTATATAIAGDDRESMEARPLKVASPEAGSPPQCSAGTGDVHPVEKLWREVGLPEYFLGNGGTNTKLYALYDAIRAEKRPNHITREPVAYVPRSKAPGSEGEPLWREVFEAKWLSKGTWQGFDLMPLYSDPPQEAREQRRAERKERTGLDVEEALTLEEDCGCIGAVIGQHERSCPLSRPEHS